MPNYSTTTTIKTSSGDIVASSSGSYKEVFRTSLQAPFGNAVTGTFQEVFQTHTMTQAGYTSDLKYLLIKNTGVTAIEISISTDTWAYSADGDDNGAEIFLRYMIASGDYMLFPNIRVVGYDTEAGGAGVGVLSGIGGATPAPNLYQALNDVVAGDAQLVNEEVDISETSIIVDDATYFYPSDLIQLETEILEVVQVTSSTAIEVVRGAYGSTAATHIDDTPIRLPFFNAYHPYGDTSINGGGDGSSALCKTDIHGRFKCFNMTGLCRNPNYDSDGIAPGSFALIFRTEGAYQELGLSGVTSSTHTGLTASTGYEFDIQVDGGTNYSNLSFITDSSNLNWGGTNGVVAKIQEALNTQYRTAGNLFERGVDVAIVGGDIRFSSRTNRSGSAIAVTGGSSGTADLLGNGTIPSTPEVAIAASCPNIYKSDPNRSPVTGAAAASHLQVPVKDPSSLAWDDGKGKISGVATGTVSYSQGAMDFTGPPNADFKVWFAYANALSGGMKSTDEACNSIRELRFRGMNYAVDASIEVIGLN